MDGRWVGMDATGNHGTRGLGDRQSAGYGAGGRWRAGRRTRPRLTRGSGIGARGTRDGRGDHGGERWGGRRWTKRSG